MDTNGDIPMRLCNAALALLSVLGPVLAWISLLGQLR
jgi:hypothetical protein